MSEKITTCLWFDNQAEEAAEFHVSVFEDGKLLEAPATGKADPVPPARR